MASKLVNVRIPEELYNEGLRIVKRQGYKNIQELIIVSLREKIMKK